jgi:alpha-tubulin suppressor-like RCC1 family protein
MIRGAVQFFEPGQDPVAQANLVLQQIGLPGFGDLPPALDVQVTGGLSPSALAAAIQTWVTTVQSALGRASIIYTGASFWNSNIGAQTGFSSDLLWIAQIGGSCPNVPAPWQSWGFWQFSNNGTVSGVGTSVDQDEFNGTLADLQKLAVPPGTPLAWGEGQLGELGDGTFHTTSPFGSSTAVHVIGLSGVIAVAGGYQHNLALRSDGTVWAWGSGGHGELGNNVLADQDAPVKVLNLSGVAAIAAGYEHSMALKSDGTVWVWGTSSDGQLGNGTISAFGGLPVQVPGLTGVATIASGGYHCLALKTDGTVWVWGRGLEGQLGNGAFQDQGTPVQLTGLSGVSILAGGAYHTLAMKSDGTVLAWGRGAEGQLGNGLFQSSSSPVSVSGLSGAVAVACGLEHSLAVKSDGTVRAWGRGLEGQLGNGAFQNSATPVQVSSLSGASAVAAGSFHSLALKSDHTVWAWGHGDYGQLGNGTFYSAFPYGSSVPVQATSLPATKAITAGFQHGLALPLDNQPPVALCQNVTVTAGTKCVASAAIDNGSYDPDPGDQIVSFTQNPPGPYSLGSTLVTLTVVDTHGASSSCQATVTVLDVTPPTLTCPAAVTISANANCAASIPDLASGATATDCNGPVVVSQSPTAGTSVGLGVSTVTVSATDAAGNTSTCTTTVTVIDTTPPALTCAEDVTVIADGNGTALIPNVLSGATAGDCNGPVSLTQSPVAGTSVGLGATPITVMAMDAAGNTTSCNTICNVVASGLMIQSVSGPTGPLALGTIANVTVQFTDSEANPDHTLLITWDDGSSTPLQNQAPGSYSAQHQYAGAGVYSIGITVTASDGRNATATFTYIVVYDPTAGFVTGGGWIQSPAGAYSANPGLVGKAEFGFNSKYAKGATVPSGQTNFKFETAGFRFDSQVYQWLVVSGAKAQYKGSGTVNDSGNYGFILTATDGQISGGGGVDKFRIKIWDPVTGTIVYDNVPGASDDIDLANPQAIGGGQIIIHK